MLSTTIAAVFIKRVKARGLLRAASLLLRIDLLGGIMTAQCILLPGNLRDQFFLRMCRLNFGN